MHTKLFIGYRLSPEWKGRVKDNMPFSLVPLTHGGKSFIGLYADSATPTLGQIRHIRDSILSQLKEAFPLHPVNPSAIVLFPVVLIG